MIFNDIQQILLVALVLLAAYGRSTAMLIYPDSTVPVDYAATF